MKTRVILFAREFSAAPESAGRILFARWGDSLEIELPLQLGVEDFSHLHGLKRHSQFDHSVGEMGRKVTLLESVDNPPPSEIILESNRILHLQWDLFRQTAAALKEGTDRRFLQLAVQYLAAGGRIDESVVAADYDAEFIKSLQESLTKNSTK